MTKTQTSETSNGVQRPVFVGASEVGAIWWQPNGWHAWSSVTHVQCGPFASDVRAECWTREELYRTPTHANPYRP